MDIATPAPVQQLSEGYVKRSSSGCQSCTDSPILNFLFGMLIFLVLLMVIVQRVGINEEEPREKEEA